MANRATRCDSDIVICIARGSMRCSERYATDTPTSVNESEENTNEWNYHCVTVQRKGACVVFPLLRAYKSLHAYVEKEQEKKTRREDKWNGRCITGCKLMLYICKRVRLLLRQYSRAWIRSVICEAIRVRAD